MESTVEGTVWRGQCRRDSVEGTVCNVGGDSVWEACSVEGEI